MSFNPSSVSPSKGSATEPPADPQVPSRASVPSLYPISIPVTSPRGSSTSPHTSAAGRTSRHGWGRSAPPKKGFQATSDFGHHVIYNSPRANVRTGRKSQTHSTTTRKSVSSLLPFKGGNKKRNSPVSVPDKVSVVAKDAAQVEARETKLVGGLVMRPEVVQFEAAPSKMPPDSFSGIAAREVAPNTDITIRSNKIKKGPKVAGRGPVLTSTAHRPRRRALLVGASYVESSTINGFPKSVKHIQALFDLLTRKLGYEKEDVWVLTDMPRQVVGACMNRVPNRCNLMAGMRWLVQESGAGDTLFFGFSGLASEAKKDENTGAWMENFLLPSDYPDVEGIPQKEVAETLLKGLHCDATLTVILDCNQAQGVLKLPYLLVADRESSKKDAIKQRFEYKDGMGANVHRLTIGTMGVFGRLHREWVERRRRVAEMEQYKLAQCLSRSGKVVAFGGCGTYVDVPFGNGTLTWAIVNEVSKSVETERPMTFRSILMGISGVVCKERRSQMAQISMSHLVHLDAPVFFCL